MAVQCRARGRDRRRSRHGRFVRPSRGCEARAAGGRGPRRRRGDGPPGRGKHSGRAAGRHRAQPEQARCAGGRQHLRPQQALAGPPDQRLRQRLADRRVDVPDQHPRLHLDARHGLRFDRRLLRRCAGHVHVHLRSAEPPGPEGSAGDAVRRHHHRRRVALYAEEAERRRGRLRHRRARQPLLPRAHRRLRKPSARRQGQVPRRRPVPQARGLRDRPLFLRRNGEGRRHQPAVPARLAGPEAFRPAGKLHRRPVAARQVPRGRSGDPLHGPAVLLGRHSQRHSERQSDHGRGLSVLHRRGAAARPELVADRGVRPGAPDGGGP
ncbi:MAG: hypothetical protein JWQ29_2830 [Phenylobacterium sp.]|nr:hypothetical protein [Phenylobacterium sp.]